MKAFQGLAGVTQEAARIGAPLDGVRLDRALVLLAPETGLRGRRRLFEHCDVLVDGVARKPGYRVAEGQEIRLAPHGLLRKHEDGGAQEGQVCRICANEDFAALFKPRGLHSASVSGSPEPCMEQLLPGLYPDLHPILLNRLDKETSGILLAAFGTEARGRYQRAQERGETLKRYLAVVHGCPEPGMVLDRALETRGRGSVRVLEEAAPLERRTRMLDVSPLKEGICVVAVEIIRGARHQIRAHLAHAGFPILGDELYGRGDEEDGLHLHHAWFSMPGFQAQCMPSWPGEAGQVAGDLLERLAGRDAEQEQG